MSADIASRFITLIALLNITASSGVSTIVGAAIGGGLAVFISLVLIIYLKRLSRKGKANDVQYYLPMIIKVGIVFRNYYSNHILHMSGNLTAIA